MTFDEWWGTLTTREQARMVKDDVAEAWQAAFQDGYEKGIAAFHEAVKVEREACAKELDAEAARLDALGVYGDDAEYVAKLATAMRSNV